jgi:hypothetical protein
MEDKTNDIQLSLSGVFSLLSDTVEQDLETTEELQGIVQACRDFENIYQEWLSKQNPFKTLEALTILKNTLELINLKIKPNK